MMTAELSRAKLTERLETAADLLQDGIREGDFGLSGRTVQAYSPVEDRGSGTLSK